MSLFWWETPSIQRSLSHSLSGRSGAALRLRSPLRSRKLYQQFTQPKCQNPSPLASGFARPLCAATRVHRPLRSTTIYIYLYYVLKTSAMCTCKSGNTAVQTHQLIKKFDARDNLEPCLEPTWSQRATATATLPVPRGWWRAIKLIETDGLESLSAQPPGIAYIQ